MTTAMVTSWEFRKVNPSKYMATAKLPSIADLRLHINHHLNSSNVGQLKRLAQELLVEWLGSLHLLLGP